MKTLNQVFDQEKFNFNKIIHKEVDMTDSYSLSCFNLIQILFYLNRKCHGSQKVTIITIRDFLMIDLLILPRRHHTCLL